MKGCLKLQNIQKNKLENRASGFNFQIYTTKLQTVYIRYDFVSYVKQNNIIF